MSDLRLAIRLMLRSPGLSLVLLGTLALGIGVNTAVFSVVQAALLRPLPYADPDRLVTVWQDLRAQGGPPDEWATPGNLSDWRAETRVFERVAAALNWTTSLTGSGEPVGLSGAHVTADYFATLGVPPALGRDFSPDDDRPGAARVVILSNIVWRERFAADPAIVGRVIVLGDEPHTVIGVMPAGFVPAIIGSAQLWRPIRLNMVSPSRGAVVLRVVARLRHGVSREQAQARMNVLARALEVRYPDSNTKAGIAIIGLQERQTARIRPVLLVLFGAVGCVLLIACANVANLLLARAAGRRREMAVRAAIGASRARIVRQLLIESGLVAALGGVLGLLVAQWTLADLARLRTAARPAAGRGADRPGVSPLHPRRVVCGGVDLRSDTGRRGWTCESGRIPARRCTRYERTGRVCPPYARRGATGLGARAAGGSRPSRPKLFCAWCRSISGSSRVGCSQPRSRCQRSATLSPPASSPSTTVCTTHSGACRGSERRR